MVSLAAAIKLLFFQRWPSSEAALLSSFLAHFTVFLLSLPHRLSPRIVFFSSLPFKGFLLPTSFSYGSGRCLLPPVPLLEFFLVPPPLLSPTFLVWSRSASTRILPPRSPFDHPHSRKAPSVCYSPSPPSVHDRFTPRLLAGKLAYFPGSNLPPSLLTCPSFPLIALDYLHYSPFTFCIFFPSPIPTVPYSTHHVFLIGSKIPDPFFLS